MDQGRYKDLARLQAVLDDPSKPMYAKRQANAAKQDILRQLKDKKLVALREQLIKAAQAFDEYGEWKIVNQIKDYMKKERMGRYS